MDTSINAINSVNNASTVKSTEASEKQTEKLKEMAAKYDFDYFDVDNDGKISGIEATRLKMIFNSVDFDKDDEDAIDESSFESAISDYKTEEE